LVPSWLALAFTGFDVALLGTRSHCGTRSTRGGAAGDMLRSFLATRPSLVLFGGRR
jgi:hypothetical protein